MKIITTIDEMRHFSISAKRDGKSVGFVPTMGSLHEGHLSLIDKASECSDIVVVSIFVNPTQFAPDEDLDSYPHDLERDCLACSERGVDVIFAPSADELYCVNATVWVVEEQLSRGLCGASRPDHFRGVATVVVKLFNIVLPDVAVFGQKDAQQLLVIKQVVRDLNIPVRIVAAPLVREHDGLAMSSRNRYLNDDERIKALSISKALNKAASDINAGLVTSATEVVAEINRAITDAGGRVDYIEICDTKTLEKVESISTPVLIAVAAFFGTTRLIDNITWVQPTAK